MLNESIPINTYSKLKLSFLKSILIFKTKQGTKVGIGLNTSLRLRHVT